MVIGGLPLARIPFRFPQHSHNRPSPSNRRGQPRDRLKCQMPSGPPGGPLSASSPSYPLPSPPPLTLALSSRLQLSCSGTCSSSDVGEHTGGHTLGGVRRRKPDAAAKKLVRQACRVLVAACMQRTRPMSRTHDESTRGARSASSFVVNLFCRLWVAPSTT